MLHQIIQKRKKQQLIKTKPGIHDLLKADAIYNRYDKRKKRAQARNKTIKIRCPEATLPYSYNFFKKQVKNIFVV